MQIRTHPRPRAPRAIALVTALATAAVLALPAAAAAWLQVGADGAGTYQAQVAGPADPGLQWFSDVSEETGDGAPDGFSFGDESLPVIGSDGTILRQAQAEGQSVGQGNRHLVGIDPADGSLAWNLPFAQGGCNPAVDSQGRAWAVFVDGADGESMLQSFDSATGERIEGTQLEPLSDVDPDAPNWCRSSVHIAGAGTSERAILFDGRGSITEGSPGILAIDLSGAQATEGWVIDPEDEDAPFDRVMQFSPDRIGAATDTHLYVATATDGQFALTELSLASGQVTNRVDLPLYDDEGAQTTVTGHFDTSVLIDGRTAVVADAGRRNATGTLRAVDLDTFEVAWIHLFDDAVFDQSGPPALALTGGYVISSSGGTLDRLYAHRLTDGTPAPWSADVNLRNGNQPRQYLTDANDTIYVNNDGPDGGGLDRSVTAISGDGIQQWRFNRAGLLDAAGLSDDGLNNQLWLGPIGSDGTLYLHREEQLIAIDGSGGLAVEDQCQLPFDDVSITSTHGANICRLVELEVTGGTTATTYSPSQQVTRAQMATFLTRALGLPAGTGQQFPDVDPGSVHAPNILAIRDAGITQGRADGTYDPGGTVTRAEMASFLARAAGLEGVDGTGFDDVDPTNDHTPNIYAVRDAQITTGTSASTYNPDGNVRRDQMASFLIRMIDVLDEG